MICLYVCAHEAECVSKHHSRLKTHLLVHLLSFPSQYNAAAGQRGLTVGFKWRGRRGQGGWRGYWWSMEVELGRQHWMSCAWRREVIDVEGWGRGRRRGVCAPPDQTVGQWCLPACWDASQPLINIVTQYVKRPGFVPDATACVSVSFKVTHFIQQDGLTLGSRGVLWARWWINMQARCFCTRHESEAHLDNSSVSFCEFLEVVGAFRCSQIRRGSLAKAGKWVAGEAVVKANLWSQQKSIQIKGAERLMQTPLFEIWV